MDSIYIFTVYGDKRTAADFGIDKKILYTQIKYARITLV